VGEAKAEGSWGGAFGGEHFPRSMMDESTLERKVKDLEYQLEEILLTFYSAEGPRASLMTATGHSVERASYVMI
jgi:hypothetical protein